MPRGRQTPAQQGSEGATALDRRVLQVADTVGEFIEYWGFKAVLGRIWTVLALASEPLSQIEIAETLGISRSLVSGAMADLAERGLVRAVGDHRNAPYEAAVDVWPVISDVLRSREWMLLEAARLALEAAIDEAEIESFGGQDIPYRVDRMRMLLNLTEMSQSLLRILISMRARSLDAFEPWLQKASTLVKSFRGGG